MVNDFVSYLKNTPGYTRILKKMKEKYHSMGHFGGTIRLDNINNDEREVLRSLFKKGFNKKSATFHTDKFIEAFNNTRYSCLDFKEVLEIYFAEPLIWKKVVRNQYLEEKECFFNEIAIEFANTPAGNWIKTVLEEKNNAYPVLWSKYDEDKEKLKIIITYVGLGLNELINNPQKTRIALFASRITKNPHSFDVNGEMGRMLLYALCFQLQMKFPSNAEEQSELLYRGGLIYDEVSNYTLCRGIKAYIRDNEHMGWAGFARYGEPLHISLWNISTIDRIKCANNRVFVFENPTVFSEITGRLEYRSCSLICSAGNVKLATLLLLDKAVQFGSHIYYGGDFDPEGLVIADKLKKRYKENLTLWHYEVEEYEQIRSNLRISDRRLKKFSTIESPQLREIVQRICSTGFGAYQELLIETYIKDIMDMMS